MGRAAEEHQAAAAVRQVHGRDGRGRVLMGAVADVVRLENAAHEFLAAMQAAGKAPRAIYITRDQRDLLAKVYGAESREAQAYRGVPFAVMGDPAPAPPPEFAGEGAPPGEPTLVERWTFGEDAHHERNDPDGW